MLSDFEMEEIFRQVEPMTMTGRERVDALVGAVEYIVENGIEGDFVECGVWKGGSLFAMMLTLQRLGDHSRQIWGYDTFDGMTAPADLDVSFHGQKAKEIYSDHANRGERWLAIPRTTVTENLYRSGYSMEKVRLVEGDVQVSLRQGLPSSIAFLRLDTDWYESTMFELQTLYPKLVPKGIMIVDDYGHWRGAKKAVDEYFSKCDFRPLLQRVDYTARLVVKCA
jgi:O-methyltransferase